MQTIQTNNQYIDDYLLQNGYQQINSPVLENAAAYVKDNNAVLFYSDVIEFKQCKPGGKIHAATVLFQWNSIAMYKGFTGGEFMLMMLLDFMGAIKLKDVSKQLRQQMNAENIINSIPQLYGENPVTARNLQIETV